MEQYIDVMRRIIELSDTIMEGLEHIRLKLEEGKSDSTFEMLNDVIAGIYSIERSMESIVNELPFNEIEALGNKLADAARKLVNAYENGYWEDVYDIMGTLMIPSYKKWQHEIVRLLKPYTLS